MLKINDFLYYLNFIILVNCNELYHIIILAKMEKFITSSNYINLQLTFVMTDTVHKV